MNNANVQYTAKAHTTGGRDGASISSDDRLNVKLSPPGTSGGGTNPEQLLAAGWSACYLSAIAVVAANMKVVLPKDRSIDAEIDLCKNETGYFLQARLNVSLPGVDRQVAQAIVEAAHQTCPYSKAIRGNVEVVTSIVS